MTKMLQITTDFKLIDYDPSSGKADSHRSKFLTKWHRIKN
jgi:hypothetical protein